MDTRRLADILEKVQTGELSPEAAADALRILPFDTLDTYARVDHHRELRSGIPEIVYGESKTAEHIAALMTSLAAGGGGALATRIDRDKASEVAGRLERVEYRERARCLVIWPETPRPPGRGPVAVVSAGTSDLPIADEAATCLEFLGHQVRRADDVGIAGLQRLVAASESLRDCTAAIAVAGFEGALPSALAGLIPAPVIAVPTSVGYGVGLGGFAALITMLAGCSPGVIAVNIDNGIGAAVAAARINRA